MFGLGPTELIIIAIILLLMFGARRLPEIGKGIGGAIWEFKNVKKEISPEETSDKILNGDEVLAKKDGITALEKKAVDKVLGQVPGVNRAIEIKKKAEKIKEIIK